MHIYGSYHKINTVLSLFLEHSVFSQKSEQEESEGCNQLMQVYLKNGC